MKVTAAASILGVVILVLCLFFLGRAGGSPVTISVEKKKAFVGEPVKVNIEVRTEAAAQVKFPDDIKGLKQLGKAVKTTRAGKRKVHRAEYTVFGDSGGRHKIGPVAIGLSKDGSGAWSEIMTPEAELTVEARLSGDIGRKQRVTISGSMATGTRGGFPGSSGGMGDGGGSSVRMVDPSADLKIEEKLETKKYFSPRAIWRMAWACAAFLVLVLSAVKIKAALRRRPPKELPPGELVLVRLDGLKKECIAEKDEKEYCARLYRIFTDFLKWRFGLGDVEMTVNELAAKLEGINIPAERKGTIISVISVCDDIKYAAGRRKDKAVRPPDIDAVTAMARELGGG